MSWHVLLEAAVNYWSSRSTRAMSIRMWAHRVTHLRGWKSNKDMIQIRLGLGALTLIPHLLAATCSHARAHSCPSGSSSLECNACSPYVWIPWRCCICCTRTSRTWGGLATALPATDCTTPTRYKSSAARVFSGNSMIYNSSFHGLRGENFCLSLTQPTSYPFNNPYRKWRWCLLLLFCP
jgi:hypothetical protein